MSTMLMKKYDVDLKDYLYLFDITDQEKVYTGECFIVSIEAAQF